MRIRRPCCVAFGGGQHSAIKSKYYSYAASDMKKAIDYGEGLEDCPQLPETEDYLRTLYEQHKRKTALWPLMADKIKGLSVGKDGIRYNGDAS